MGAPKPRRRRRKVSGFNESPVPEVELSIETADGDQLRVRPRQVVDVVLIMPNGDERPL